MKKFKFAFFLLLSILCLSCGSRYQDDSAKYCRDGKCYIESTITNNPAPNPCSGFWVAGECMNQPPDSYPGAGSTPGSRNTPEKTGPFEGCLGDCRDDPNAGPSTASEMPDSDNKENSAGAAIGSFFSDLGKGTSKAWNKIRDEINGKNSERRRKAREAKRLLSQAKDLWAQAEVYRRSIDTNRDNLRATLSSLQTSVAAADGDNLNQSLERFRLTYNEQVRSILAKVPDVQDDAFAPGNDRSDESIYSEKEKIDQGRKYVDYAAAKVEAFRSQRDYVARKKLISVSEHALDESEASFKSGNIREGSQLFELGMAAADIAISVTPVVGWGKDIYEAASGRALLDGRTLTSFERSMAVVGIFTAGVGSKLAAAGKLRKIVNILSNSARGGEDAALIAKIGARAEDIFYSAKEIGWGVSELKTLTKSASEIKQYGPLERGVLHDIPTPSGGSVADTFRSSSYFEVTSKEPIKMYRVYGGNASELAPYWSRTKPTGPLQAQLDAAILPDFRNTAAKWVEIEVPAGTKFFDGAASPQYLRAHGSNMPVGQLLGGGNQVYIPRVNPGWITGRGAF